MVVNLIRSLISDGSIPEEPAPEPEPEPEVEEPAPEPEPEPEVEEPAPEPEPEPVRIFDINGNISDSISVESGSSIEVPVAPDVEGYTFINWYAGLEYLYVTSFDNILKDTNAYPKYEKNIITEETPNASILYTNSGSIQDLEPSSLYTLNGTEYFSSATEGKIGLLTSWYNTSISIIKKARDESYADSDVQVLDIPDRAAAPSVTGTTTGSITGVNNTMQYRKQGDSSYINIESDELTGLDDGTYQVRYGSTDTAFASANTSVDVTNVIPEPEKESTPDARVNYTGGTINNLEVSSAYTINDIEYTSNTSGAITVVSAWYGNDINIVKNATEDTVDSDTQVLSIPARPATPTPSAGDGAINDVDETMSWRVSGGTWADVTGTSVTGLEAGTYQVRVTATSTTFASANATVTITETVSE